MTLCAEHLERHLSSADLACLMRDVLAKGAFFRFKARGPSMTPFVKDGDIITVAPCPSAELRTGDIIAFTYAESGRLAVHRIVGIRGESFLVKGDNALSFDGIIPQSQILGHVTRIERNGRSIRLGLGLGRKVFAFLSRFHITPALLIPARKLYRLLTPGPVTR
jgi:hypothetical protein